jgi:GT2 family glycosyltransferase
MTASEEAAPDQKLAGAVLRPVLPDSAQIMADMFVDRPNTMEFNELAYLATFPDVQKSIETGRFGSAWAHWRAHGAAEDRLSHANYRGRFGKAGRLGPAGPGHIDLAYIGETGLVLLIGWAADPLDPLTSVSVAGRPGFNSFAMARFRRPDVEEAHLLPPGDYGVVALVPVHEALGTSAPLRVRLRYASGAGGEHEVTAKRISNLQLSQMMLDHIGRGPSVEPFYLSAFTAYDTGLGDLMSRLSNEIAASYCATPLELRHGLKLARPVASVIVCLYGKPEWLFVQNALFGACDGMDQVEFIYVCNSPDLADRLDKDLRIGATAYGLDQRLIVLGGNAGFSAACNIGAAAARSDRLIFANPDLFPREADWLASHQAILDGFPAAATRLFGGMLYYDDGALMHAGMYLETDRMAGKTAVVPMLRVEHYGKGFPPASPTLTRPRPVPAVSGAFICAARDWFEELGGFSPEYMLGHYEDADLCLRSLQRGVPPWVHRLPFWHLEGKGAGTPPGARGASALNRWAFTRRWQDVVADGLEGPAPSHAALTATTEPAEA